jgi:hypothetical protein
MSRNKTVGPPRQDRAWVSAADWLAPDLLAAAIRDIAARHGVGTPPSLPDDMTPRNGTEPP